MVNGLCATGMGRSAYRVLAQSHAPLARCYRRALGLDPTISNRANLSFGIDKKGHGTAPVAISDTDQLDTCLHAAMKKWQFPPGKAMASTWMTVTLRAR